MSERLLRWATTVGAFSRILDFEKLLLCRSTYIERLRFVNQILGPDWVFRLTDLVGSGFISESRSSWYKFYIEDHDGLHLPLDPGAPETLEYLGVNYSIKDLAFYAGMGFDGYTLALKTPRIVDSHKGTINFDGTFSIHHEALQSLCWKYRQIGFINKEFYYQVYAEALDSLFKRFSDCLQNPNQVDLIEHTAAAALIFMCGGHSGCTKHPSEQERFEIQMESLVIFSCTIMLCQGLIFLKEEKSYKSASL